jgi:hypothetical protein
MMDDNDNRSKIAIKIKILFYRITVCESVDNK